jgi:hypothetical protein
MENVRRMVDAYVGSDEHMQGRSNRGGSVGEKIR